MEADNGQNTSRRPFDFEAFSPLKVSAWSNPAARWGNRILLLGLLLLAGSLPHSIAAGDISLGICLLGWVIRDTSLRSLTLTKTGFEWPILCFSAWTILSSILSVEPAISVPKTRGLLLFGILYLVVSNLNDRGARFLLVVLVASGLSGSLFSIGEKLAGRGVIIDAIHTSSPLSGSGILAGDVIWLVNRKRVASLDEINGFLRRATTDTPVEIEALHNGDPIPVNIVIDEHLRTDANPIGIAAGGRSRQFRASGFSRHFLTFAEQMQLLALFVLGAVLWQLRKIGSIPWIRPLYALPVFAAFSIALGLTATRAVIASFLLALFIAAATVAPNRRVAVALLAGVLLIGGFATVALLKTRDVSTARFSDDSTARRIGYMKAGLKLIPRHPLFGVGMDSHKLHWSSWGFPGSYITHTHSTPIQLAMERGLPALGCYLWLFGAFWLSFYKNYRKKGHWFELGGLGCVAGFFLSSLTNYNFGDSESLMLLYFILSIALAARQHRAPETISNRTNIDN